MLIENSGDLLNIVIALFVFLCTVFLIWSMYYFIKTLRNVSSIVTGVKEKMDTIDKILNLVHDKLEKGSSHMAILSETVVRLVSHLVDKQTVKKKQSKKKK